MENEHEKRKQFSGVVVSDTAEKTRTVLVNRFVKHPKYGKYQKGSKKFKAHDEENAYHKGDTVQIEECRPISKEKHFRIVSGEHLSKAQAEALGEEVTVS
jgi:small subunit ribosomal protein S17